MKEEDNFVSQQGKEKERLLKVIDYEIRKIKDEDKMSGKMLGTKVCNEYR